MPPDDHLPTNIGPYDILGLLGEGGMGTVYLAEQHRPVRRRVALKVIRLGMDTQEVITRFESERQALAMMNHPGIARVLDAGTTDHGLPYFVMEHVPGVPITDYCDRHRLTTRERLELFVPVCQALHHAHQKGIIHRDVKPSNVLVMLEDGKPVPKVIDFGVAKAISQRLTERTMFTRQGQLIGTPAYMSPEQAEMSGLNVDTTTDVYSLGILLYELLAGAPPFETKTLLEEGWDAIHHVIRDVDPPKPSTRISTLGDRATDVASHRRTDPAQLQRQVRGELDWITMRAIEKDRTRRYQSAVELGADVQRYLRDEPIVARPPSVVYQVRKFAKRNRALVAGACAVVVVLVAGVIVSTWQAVRATRAERLARQRLEQAERQTRRADAINAFLQDMISSSDPAKTKGAAVTVREALDAAAKKVDDGQLENQPEVEAAVRSTIGETYRKLGMVDAAGLHIQKAYDIRRRLYGDANLEVLQSLNSLSAWTYDSGDYAAAESLGRLAVASGRKIPGDSPEMAIALSRLSKFITETRETPEVDTLMRGSLAMIQRLDGNESPRVATALYNLSAHLANTGQIAESESLSRVALAMDRKLLGDDDPKTIVMENYFGEFLAALGKADEADTLFERALLHGRKVMGEKHEEVIIILANLSHSRRMRGEWKQAEALARQVFALRREALGIDHPRTARAEGQLASLLTMEGRYAEAEPLYRESIANRRKRLPPGHPFIAAGLNGYGWLRLGQKRYAEAEAMLREARAIWAKTPPENDLDLSEATAGLGCALAAHGRPAEAESLLVRGCQEMNGNPKRVT